jgi:hypothetical protein
VIQNYTNNSGDILYKFNERSKYRRQVGKRKPAGKEGTGRRVVDGMEEAVGSETWLSPRSFAVCR